MDIQDQSSFAVTSPVFHYGAIDTLAWDQPESREGTRGAAIGTKVKFLLGELTGLLFILLSTVYIFVMPARLAQPGELRNAFNRMIKRSIDILGASVGLLLAAPIMAVVALAVKFDSPGPALYTQVRVGVNRRKGNRRYCQRTGVASERRGRDRRREDLMGRPFNIVKFRTMVVDAEKKSGPVWATKNDPRITRLGAFLRKTRLDELPQLWSILKGDMSLVGPRPERPKFVAELSQKVDDYHHRLDMKPGLTGLAQVENGYDSSVASVARKVKFDLDYIRGWSLWTDVRILLKTVVVVVTGKGAC